MRVHVCIEFSLKFLCVYEFTTYIILQPSFLFYLANFPLVGAALFCVVFVLIKRVKFFKAKSWFSKFHIRSKTHIIYVDSYSLIDNIKIRIKRKNHIITFFHHFLDICMIITWFRFTLRIIISHLPSAYSTQVIQELWK